MELKSGHVLKCYCMFVKKGSGIALTLSKKKIKSKIEAADDTEQVESLTSRYLPTAEEIESSK